MSLLVLPTVVVASQEAIRSVPSVLLEGSYGLGATKWQTMYQIVLPYAFPGIITGCTLAISRAIGGCTTISYWGTCVCKLCSI